MLTIKSYQLSTQGFVALMGSIVISIVLLIIATEAAWLGWSTRFMVLTTELKVTSVYLAHQCAEQAINRLLQNPQYLGDETLSNGSGVCQVAPLSIEVESDPSVTVRVRVESGGVVTHHEYLYHLEGIQIGKPLPAAAMIVAPMPSMKLVSWREL